jgi:hypothetical protein
MEMLGHFMVKIVAGNGNCLYRSFEDESQDTTLRKEAMGCVCE